MSMQAEAQRAAERLARGTGATVVATVVFHAEPSPGAHAIHVGAWCPDTKVLTALLRKVADDLDSGSAQVVDSRPRAVVDAIAGKS